MRSFIFIVVAAILSSFQPVGKISVYAGEGVAIAELFTSEGCSSCPAADQMLEEMVGIMNKENKPVIGLAFHITYWDHLGWKDSFSQEIFTARQKKYCEVLQVPNIYTPQMVINGAYQFVGSDPISFRGTVEQVLAEPALYHLDAHASLKDNVIKVSYSVDKKPRHEKLNIALVEISASRDIQRGENKNKKLKHYNVVRELQSADLLPSGESQVTLPQDLDPNNSAIIAYIQHQRNLKILGATRINFAR